MNPVMKFAKNNSILSNNRRSGVTPSGVRQSGIVFPSTNLPLVYLLASNFAAFDPLVLCCSAIVISAIALSGIKLSRVELSGVRCSGGRLSGLPAPDFRSYM